MLDKWFQQRYSCGRSSKNIPKTTPRAVELMSGKTDINQPKRQTVFGLRKQVRLRKKEKERIHHFFVRSAHNRASATRFSTPGSEYLDPPANSITIQLQAPQAWPNSPVWARRTVVIPTLRFSLLSMVNPKMKPEISSLGLSMPSQAQMPRKPPWYLVPAAPTDV